MVYIFESVLSDLLDFSGFSHKGIHIAPKHLFFDRHMFTKKFDENFNGKL